VGFKADTSFLKKLTMGATATKAAMQHLSEIGFVPIELERYSTSNKIWATKVKRLRLADVLCIRTGMRFEVRAKSDLQVRMSDSPKKPDRRWDSGLRDDDLIALIACAPGTSATVLGAPIFFSVADLRASVHLAKLGSPKSAGEGAEQDLTWSSIVPAEDGAVLEVTADHLRVEFRSGRRHTYRLNGKVAYSGAGTDFIGGASIIAGAPPRVVNPITLLSRTWSAATDLASATPTDRYAAAKALGHGAAVSKSSASQLLENALDVETEHRAALEIAGALARLGVARGFEYLSNATTMTDPHFPAYLRMEAILILSELSSDISAAALDAVAGSAALRGDEIRQAAVWGLGHHGIRRYDRIVNYVADPEDEVALHAIAALGSDATNSTVQAITQILVASPDLRARAAASAALARIGSSLVASSLLAANASNQSPWILATLGRLPQAALDGAHVPANLRLAIQPVALLTEANNWLATPESATGFQFLLQQDM